MTTESSPNPLPYTDAKAVGAADFYFVINATFKYIQNRFGADGLVRYWRELGAGYYAPVSAAWRRGGLPAIADYWRAFFAAEPHAEVQVVQTPEQVELQVRTCPAILHLRAHHREILPSFCQHCYHVSEAIGAPAGFAVRIEGGNGSCIQRFLSASGDLAPQDTGSIKEAR